MDLLGYARIGTEFFVVGMRNTASLMTIAVYGQYTRDDVVSMAQGKAAVNTMLTQGNYHQIKDLEPYLIAIVSRKRSTGAMTQFGPQLQTSRILQTIISARQFYFPKDSVIVNNESFSEEDAVSRVEFSAKIDDSTYYSYKTEDGVYLKLELGINGVFLELRPGKLGIKLSEYNDRLLPVKQEREKEIREGYFKSASFEILKDMLDLRWFFDYSTGQFIRKYIAIRNKVEFETNVFTPLVKALQKAKALGEELKLTIDTETTGFKFLNLSRNNPLLDKLVCISMSWEDNFSALIFVDMAYFDNVDKSYVLNRLAPFLTRTFDNSDLERKVVYYETKHADILIPKTDLNSFSEFRQSSGIRAEVTDNELLNANFKVVEFEFNRNDIIVIAHNALFDGKVFYHEGLWVWFDADTLSMAFTLYPKLAKGNNKLENMILKLLGIEVPTLSMVTGKNNEDMYRYIDDLRVALLYAGSDTDNLRQIYKILREALGEEMYQLILKQDMFHLNWAFVSEYYGMRTDREGFIDEAERTRIRLEFLQNTMYSYVGKYIYNSNLTSLVKERAKTYTDPTSPEAQKEIKIYLEHLTKENKPTSFTFKVGGDDLRTVLFNILKYPILKRNKPSAKYEEGAPSADKFVLEKLCDKKLKESSEITDRDLVVPSELDADGKPMYSDSVLVKAEDLNLAEFPLALLLSKYGTLYKEYTSYLKPFVDEDTEGIISRPYSFTRIETFRIMNSLQTVKAALKRLITAYDEDSYVMVIDQSQVEPRILMGESEDTENIEKFKDPEKDYHTENAARITAQKAHLLDKKTRKNYKATTLGLLYGLGIPKLCISLFKKITATFKYETSVIVDNWQKVNHLAWSTMNKYRDMGTVPIGEGSKVKLSDKAFEYIGKMNEKEKDSKFGGVKNIVGRYRLLNLDNMDNEKLGKVRRAGGNFRIQSTAAEIFRTIIRRLVLRMVKEKLWDWNKFKIMMLIHDEIVMSVHKSYHPIQMIKILYESCVITLKGHTTFFIGVNIGDNWADGKDDSAELPILFVIELIKRWDNGEFRDDDYWNAIYTFRNSKGKLVTYKGPKAYIARMKQNYLVSRITSVVGAYLPKFTRGEELLSVKKLLPIFENYMVRSYVNDFFPPNIPYGKKPDDGESDQEFEDRVFNSHFESYLMDVYGEGYTYIDNLGNNKVIVARDFTEKPKEESIELDLDFGFLDEVQENEDTVKDEMLREAESFFSFDDAPTYGSNYVDYNDIDDSELNDDQFVDKYFTKGTDKNGNTIFNNKVVTKFRHIKEFPGQVMIPLTFVKRMGFKNEILQKYQTNTNRKGIQIVFDYGGVERWVYLPENIDLNQIDELVGKYI